MLRSSRLSLGAKMLDFEKQVCQLTILDFCIAVSSGTAGLHLCVRALGIGPGDEVIVPSFTFVAVANAVRYEGATPVFVDIEERTLNMDPACMEAAITPLQTTSSERSAVLDNAQLENLLAIGRDSMALTRVLPGVVEPGGSGGYGSSSLGTSGTPTVNGVNSEYN